MKKIAFPSDNEYAFYYEQYLKLVNKELSVLTQLKNTSKEFVSVLKTLSEEQLEYRYAEGKWTIKDILQHLIDTERVFIYRAMRFARNDKTALPFFDENEFAKMAHAHAIPINKLIKEYSTTRNATIAFFNNMDTAKLKRIGTASNFNMSVRACVWIIAAHELHHFSMIKQKYLVEEIVKFV
jgi:uncharacterized damage-inducible protein DinB